MPLRRLLSLIVNNSRMIETLSETKFFRRAAQITVGLYNRVKARGFLLEESLRKEIESTNISDSNQLRKSKGFYSTFKDELIQEHNKMKKDGKL